MLGSGARRALCFEPLGQCVRVADELTIDQGGHTEQRLFDAKFLSDRADRGAGPQQIKYFRLHVVDNGSREVLPRLRCAAAGLLAALQQPFDLGREEETVVAGTEPAGAKYRC